jgi:hypothetical protein
MIRATLSKHHWALTDKQKADAGLLLLLTARDLFKVAGNKRTAARIQSAISSARGAVRVQQYRETRKASQ